ncbi:hypothetical protein E1B28_008702 [Marasmius oreades]|uniref:Uncharacterized protein n=1 Tax=Marasmius oreades TaxID=181124 RepID=A0A9P7UTJ6_9AGAR|nr:uncharacterized protein E1B28_008702 [Marasmius oreades]KAG7092341.1 hypothetical protein E1B28_008702 [Marasmius oreades]
MASDTRGQSEEFVERFEPEQLDELSGGAEEGNTTTGGESSPTIAKRGRGRPKGSKNKNKAGASSVSAATAGSSSSTVPRKRGRPPKVFAALNRVRDASYRPFCGVFKEKKANDLATDGPPPKKRRGRPPKNPRPDSSADAEAATSAGDEEPKKKRGRPPLKKPST